jgi:Na+/proline symporter
VAAILAAAMSNLSAALNSLAATSVIDFYKPLAGGRDEAHYLRVARGATVLWGAALLGIGYLARQWGPVLEAGLSIASVIYGALLGIFLLGVLTRRVGETAAMLAMMAGLAAMAAVKFWTPIAWTWYVMIGTVVTFAAGWTASLFTRETAGG